MASGHLVVKQPINHVRRFTLINECVIGNALVFTKIFEGVVRMQAVIDKTVADFQSWPVSSQQLKRFYQQHQSVFERPARVALGALRFETPGDAP